MSNQTLEYRGFYGSIEPSLEDGILHGKVLWIRDTVTYEGETLTQLEKDFQSAVDDYLEVCERNGVSADVPCSGTFQIRVDPSIHRRARIAAHNQSISLNEFVAGAIELRLQQQPAAEVHHHHHHHYGGEEIGVGSTYSKAFSYRHSQVKEIWPKGFNIVPH